MRGRGAGAGPAGISNLCHIKGQFYAIRTMNLDGVSPLN